MPQPTVETECKRMPILESEAIPPANGVSRSVGTEHAQGLKRVGIPSPPPNGQPSRIGTTNDCLKPFQDDSWRAFPWGGSLTELMGTSSQIQKVIEVVESVARYPFAVLIEGETGTGKELIARAIHRLSGRREREFMAVDCGAIPETLIESQLFGYEKGAFTGAHQRKEGSFQVAHGGSLFLDEIANLPLTMQSKLLRTLQERQVHPLGAKYALPVNVRIIAASNVSLEREMRAGRFRHDLYYRLSEFVVTLPPLRERVEDIPYLANCFLAEASHELRRPVPRLSEEATQLLLHYPWPGNVRELRNVMRRATLLTCDGIWPEHLLALSTETCSAPPFSDPDSEQVGCSLKGIAAAAAAEAEQRAIRQALQASKGNKSEAARHLQTDYKTLYLKLKQYGIEAREYRMS
jgi:transcriptional regulator with PAS, ATPase and Fis domain